MRSLFCCLFQAHSAFSYIVTVANTRRCLRTQNEIILSKTELPVKKLNSAFLRPHDTDDIITVRYIEKGDSSFT